MYGDESLARIKLSGGKVLLISNFSITRRFLHADFICNPGPGVSANSGHLTVFELFNKNDGVPSFTARWDGSKADRQPVDLELDISSVPVSVVRKFKNNRDGYNGYHLDKSPDLNRRLYEVRIETPSGLLLDADISFFSTYEIASREHPDIDAVVDAAALRAETLTLQPENKPRGLPTVSRLTNKLRSCFTYLSRRRQ
ncbi:MAG TPA: hypothetical protein VHW90_07180 [Stellaceae bacterium]|jgi:hypothetical protein|nr:hypothetical protein [Stellaceae bacterium]